MAQISGLSGVETSTLIQGRRITAFLAQARRNVNASLLALHLDNADYAMVVAMTLMEA